MELYTSSNFLGYFIKEDDANVLQRISLKFLKEISESSELSLELILTNIPVTVANKHFFSH